MGKLIARANVACCENPRIRRLQPRIHLDPALVELDTGRFQPDSFDIRGSADTDKNLVDRHIVLLTM
jgi:hypothetical protein